MKWLRTLTVTAALLLTGAVAINPPDDPFFGKNPTNAYSAVVSLHLFEGSSSFCSAVVLEEGVLLTAAHCEPWSVSGHVLIGDTYHEIQEWVSLSNSRLSDDLAVIFIDDDHDWVYTYPLISTPMVASDIGRPLTQVGFGHGEKYATDSISNRFFGKIAGTDWFTWAAMSSQVNPGDSGGAVLWYCPDVGETVLIGITIAVWRNQWTEKPYINIATRLDLHREWINDTIRDYQERTADDNRRTDPDTPD